MINITQLIMVRIQSDPQLVSGAPGVPKELHKRRCGGHAAGLLGLEIGLGAGACIFSEESALGLVLWKHSQQVLLFMDLTGLITKMSVF